MSAGSRPARSAFGAALVPGLRFTSELAVLAALAAAGATGVDGWRSIGLAIALPAVAATGWGRYVAPKSPHVLADPLRAGVEALIFTAGVIGLVLVGRGGWAIALGFLAALPAIGVRLRTPVTA